MNIVQLKSFYKKRFEYNNKVKFNIIKHFEIIFIFLDKCDEDALAQEWKHGVLGGRNIEQGSLVGDNGKFIGVRNSLVGCVN